MQQQLFFGAMIGGIVFGVIWGAECARPYGATAVMVGRVFGVIVGLGLAWLHARLVLWVARPRCWEGTSIIFTGALGWLWEQMLLSATVVGLFGSWMGTFLPVMFLTLPSKPHSAMSRWEIAAIFASVGVGSYSVLWCARKIVDWFELRYRRAEKENRPSD